jgi:hypothetical protein
VATTAAGNEIEGFVPDQIPEIRMPGRDVVIPIGQGTLAYDAGRSLLASFEKEAGELSEGYRRQRELAESGQVSQRDFANSLDSFDLKWRELGTRLLETQQARDPALIGLRGTLAAVVKYQSTFLSSYAAAVRSRDATAVERAMEQLALANEMLERARLFVS